MILLIIVATFAYAAFGYVLGSLVFPHMCSLDRRIKSYNKGKDKWDKADDAKIERLTKTMRDDITMLSMGMALVWPIMLTLGIAALTSVMIYKSVRPVFRSIDNGGSKLSEWSLSKFGRN